ADDRAVGHSFRDSVALAAALVRVARLGFTEFTSPVMTSLVEVRNLEERVNRLLRGDRSAEAPKHMRPMLAAGALLAIGLGVILIRPSSMEAAHRLLEYLV